MTKARRRSIAARAGRCRSGRSGSGAPARQRRRSVAARDADRADAAAFRRHGLSRGAATGAIRENGRGLVCHGSGVDGRRGWRVRIRRNARIAVIMVIWSLVVVTQQPGEAEKWRPAKPEGAPARVSDSVSDDRVGNVPNEVVADESMAGGKSPGRGLLQKSDGREAAEEDQRDRTSPRHERALLSRRTRASRGTHSRALLNNI